MRQPSNSKSSRVKKSEKASLKHEGGNENTNNDDEVAAEENNKKLSGSWESNDKFQQRNSPPPVSIDFYTFSSILIPPDWGAKAFATNAAKGTQTMALLIGNIELTLVSISAKDMKSLTLPNEVAGRVTFNDDGEFNTPVGQIPLSRLLEISNKSYKNGVKDKELLHSLYSLQCPQTSPWKKPFIRLVSNHFYNKKTESASIQLYVYFTRLVFELIADPSIKNVVDNIKNVPAQIIPVQTKQAQAPMFKSFTYDPSVEKDLKFSLPGILKRAESAGYKLCAEQPAELNVQLFDFQKSTYQWMLDQENDARGLNSYFWEEWKYPNTELPVFYFPLAGEFRLTSVPKSNGGLLCEEMGLGKTVEIISLILGNPFVREVEEKDDNEDNERRVKTTMIVVPINLVEQWWRELNTRVSTAADGSPNSFQVLNLSDSQTWNRTIVRLTDLRLAADKFHQLPSEWGLDFDRRPIGGNTTYFHANVEFRAPWIARDRVLKGKLKHFNNSYQNLGTAEVNYVDFDIESFDVVLVSYEILRERYGYKILCQNHWHRIVLDECQELKCSTSLIASQCSNLKASYRWMVSGTPLINKIDDLNGELKFLKVWPFCLSDKDDGFWLQKIGKPFASKDEHALKLLYALIDVVMIRHSKSQRYIADNRKLVQIPERTIEWRPFDITNPLEKFVVSFLERFAAEAFLNMSSFFEGNVDNVIVAPHYSQIKSLHQLISKCITHGSAISLQQVDHLQRLLLFAKKFAIAEVDGSEVPLMSAEEAMAVVQMGGMGNAGGMNKDTNRVLTATLYGEKDMELRQKYEELSLRELRDLVESKDLPIPMEWIPLAFQVSVEENSTMMLCYHKPHKPPKVPKNGKAAKAAAVSEPAAPAERVTPSYVIAANDELKVTIDASTESVVTVDRVIDGRNDEYAAVVHISNAWLLAPVVRLPVFKRRIALRRQPYIDLLVSKDMVALRLVEGMGSLHEQGFSSIHKLMADQQVDCPLCLCEVTRPVVTSCVHVHCRLCILSVFNDNPSPKCPVCRRALKKSSLIEIKRQEDKDRVPAKAAEEAKASDQVEVDGNAKEPACEAKGPASMSEAVPTQDRETTSKRRKVVPREFYSSSSSSSSSSSVPTASSSSSSLQQTSPAEREDSVFIVPPLRAVFPAPTQAEIDDLPCAVPSWLLNTRDHTLPSLTPKFLSLHGIVATARYISARLQAVLSDMQTVLKNDPFAKFVIFSAHRESLVACSNFFEEITLSQDGNERALISVIVDSKSNREEKQKNLKRFNEDPNCNICLLTSGVAATGLTLTVAHVCYMLEPLHNAAEEAQALARVHRIGQTHSVRCVIFFAANTGEERLLALRQSRKALTEMLVDSAAVFMSTTFAADASDKKSVARRKKPVRGGRARTMQTYCEEEDDDYEDREEVQERRREDVDRHLKDTAQFFTLQNMQQLYGVSDEQLKAHLKADNDSASVFSIQDDSDVEVLSVYTVD